MTNATASQPKTAAGQGRPPIGVLLLQLGTPDDASVPAVRRYLREFLSDRRIIEANPVLWWFLLNGVILPFRPAKSAEKYRRIWDAVEGMPLLKHSRAQESGLQAALGPGFRVRLAMRYGSPNVSEAAPALAREGVERLIAVPMYPQYSATTTASAKDGLFQALMTLRRVPAVTVAPPYYEAPAYLDAQAQLIREELARLGRPPDYHLLSFHGIPQRYARAGDPYALHVERTTRGLVQRLGWRKGTWARTYQSLFGREKWLKPYTEEKLSALAKAGVKRVFVATPGFTADCLETIDEIGYEAAHSFRRAGGEELIRCPCLNAHPAWIAALAALVREAAGPSAA